MDVLRKIVSLEVEASDFGFQWETADQIMEQIQSECVEIKEHLEATKNKDALQEEIGDLMHAVFSLCVFCQLDPLDTLSQTVNKFERRLNAVKDITKELKRTNLNGCSFDELMNIWKQAKKRVG